MHISKITLENIKSHASSTFEFNCGTTAITGENGAGKTTIIEAIAWTLFDLLEYKKEDFVRRGAKKGSVTVTFESGLDEREYVVYRDSGAGYNVTDPRLKLRIADKKEEVYRFLWQHLGLEPGTDLKSLFRQAIGVPQGTFTAIFLDGATERKSAFDRLLKVEEYRQAAEKLRETSRYLEMQVNAIREGIARSEGELSRFDQVEQEHRRFVEQTRDLISEIEELEKNIAEKRTIVSRLDETERIENSITAIKAEQKLISEKIDTVRKSRGEIEELRPKIAVQEKHESAATGLREKIAVAKAIEKQLKALDKRIELLRKSYKTNMDVLRDAEAKAAGAGNVIELENRGADLIRHIAGLMTGLERDEKFQSEIKNGLCPILSEKCLNLKPGQTLEEFVSRQFTDYKSQIAALETEQSSVTNNLQAAREAERSAAAVNGYRHREAELKTEGVNLKTERQTLDKEFSGVADLEKELADIDTYLRELGDPRSRVRFLEVESEREPEFLVSAAKFDADLKRLESERQIIIDQLRNEAGGWESYDPIRHHAERSAFHEMEKRLAERRATFAAAKNREEQLALELTRFAEIRKTMQAELREKERLTGVTEATTFIRDTLKEAAPRVARNYVHHISLEANQLFREITGNAERSLKWAEDYSIILEEDGYERPFVSLSGGEQMSAALAVRLALLKQLSDIRIAFFDEPTTNMDETRRENFAQQISRITNFDQLFVISHDDTFDSYVDNVLVL